MKLIVCSLLFFLSLNVFAQNRSTLEVYRHHEEALLNKNKAEIMKDYDENSIIVTPDGKVNKGLEEISKTFDYAFAEFFPENIEMHKLQEVIEEGIVFLVYKVSDGTTGKEVTPFAVDTFVIEDGKIKYQTIASQMPPEN
ncbi:nuclear transport factor 2 family protein [Gramella sp. KN1008]|uniref:nuclear transport factor 2 family protein n=1 Tax=Gramella sp. KN1008 TaxID=2529298 RepID=UPI001038DD45|nr:nuclear transport factor 2 family protein [Gramella sp. KN1008]TBW30260.1 nuclear transport factor 2 family protein [Gramella sp. KN1008]